MYKSKWDVKVLSDETLRGFRSALIEARKDRVLRAGETPGTLSTARIDAMTTKQLNALDSLAHELCVLDALMRGCSTRNIDRGSWAALHDRGEVDTVYVIALEEMYAIALEDFASR